MIREDIKAKGKSDLKTIQQSAITAGVGLIAMAILAPIAHFGIFGSMIDQNNFTETLENIHSGTAMFLFGAICLFAVAVLDIIVALALKKFFMPAKNKLTDYMTWLRIVYACIFMVAIAYLLVLPLRVYAGLSIGAKAVESGVTMFGVIWDVALVLFAAHLIILGWIFYKTAYTPKWIASLLAIAGLGYGVDSVGKLFISGYNIEVATVAFIGEVVLIFWLLVKGRRVAMNPKKATKL